MAPGVNAIRWTTRESGAGVVAGVADRRRVVASGSGDGPDAVCRHLERARHLQERSLTLVGFLFKPDGAGPFPALVWNHGSERNPGTMRQFDAVASIFVPAGFVVFAPMRRGHGDSEGPYIMDPS